MYRPPHRLLEISLTGISSGCGRWQVDATIAIKLPGDLTDWSDLNLADTLDYGALCGQIRFILDMADDPKPSLEAYHCWFPGYFPDLDISSSYFWLNQLTITPIAHREHSFGAVSEVVEKAQEGSLTAAILVCSGSPAGAYAPGTWLLTPYADLTKLDTEAKCIVIPYSGELDLSRCPQDYFDYTP